MSLLPAGKPASDLGGRGIKGLTASKGQTKTGGLAERKCRRTRFTVRMHRRGPIIHSGVLLSKKWAANT
jgi:hypothetical protein